MPNITEQEHNRDQQLLKEMGIATNQLVYPKQLSTKDEEELRELQWLIIMARS